MNVLLWDEVAEDWQQDGALRDVYVFDTNEADWQRVVDSVRMGWSWSYQEDGEPARMPHAVGHMLRAASRHALLWQVKLRDGVFANCHFFSSEEVEFDLDPREVSSQSDLEAVCEFVRVLGQAAAKPAVVCMENSPDLSIARYDPSTDRITRVPPQA